MTKDWREGEEEREGERERKREREGREGGENERQNLRWKTVSNFESEHKLFTSSQ